MHAPGKKHTSAETQAYLPHLDRLLKQHASKGRVDPRRPDCRDDLLRDGVPLEQRPVPRWSRPDLQGLDFQRGAEVSGEKHTKKFHKME